MYHITIDDSPKGINNQLLPAKFYYRQELSQAKSLEQGKQVFDRVLYIKISDNPYNIVDRKATERDRLLYRRELAEFEARNIRVSEGTPLDVLFSPESGYAAAIRSQDIYSVEELAQQKNHEFAQKAQRYLDYMSSAGAFHKHEEEIALRDREILALKQEINLWKTKFENYKAAAERAAQIEGFIDSNPSNTPGNDHQRQLIDAAGKERKIR